MTTNRKQTKQQQDQLNGFDSGYIPPQATDIEDSVLGCLMMYPDTVDSAIDELNDSDIFYKTENRLIFIALRELYAKTGSGKGIDIKTICEQLNKKGKLDDAGGAYYVSSLTSTVTTSLHFEMHIKILKEKYMSRRLIGICSQSMSASFNQEKDIFDLLSDTENAIAKVSETEIAKDTQKIDSVFGQSLKNIEQKVKDRRDGISSDVNFGFRELDVATGGLHPGDLTIIAARPGMGKTAFALTTARNVVINQSKPVAFFTLEVTSEQIVNRLISMESGIELTLIRDGRLEDDDLSKITNLNDLINSNLYIDDTSSLSMSELRSKCRRLKNRSNIELIIVDYIQLMRFEFEKGQKFNRDQEIGNISRGLKSLAKELSVPVIALSQLSRAVETRGGDKRPQLSDLRESGSIEQDADNVAFIYRPEYYNIDQTPDGDSTEGLSNYIIAKHRHGQIGDIKLSFNAKHTRFTNYKYEITNIPSGIDSIPEPRMKPRKSFYEKDENEIPF